VDQKKAKVFREKLLEKRQEILVAYNKTKSYGKEADAEGSQDVADKAASSYTKEFLFSLSNSERDQLQLVDDAIARLNTSAKTFGICVTCDSEVEKKRLEAVPWAKHCLTCQEKQEQGLI
jgi:DnaK suppressor protein